jgi:phenylalanyl-tRNA synthetase alpha chain
VLSSLAGAGPLSFEALVASTSLQEDQVRRGLQWLASKGLISIADQKRTTLQVVREPPELALVKKVEAAGGPLSIDSLKALFESQEEFSAALGRARSSGWIRIENGAPPVVHIADSEGPSTLNSLIQSVSAGANEESMPSDQGAQVADLLKRGVLKRAESRSTTVTITQAGRDAAAGPAGTNQIDRLTPEVIASRSWRGKSLRPIDVEAKAPRFYPGRRHPVRDFINEVREAYISMGFTELRGESVYPAFWNFDALFTPQDHPSREMQDTFYIEGISDNRMKRAGVVANVAATHENGWKTGSKGWGYRWRIEEARRLVLRTHNTVLTVKALADSKEKETRVFAVSKVYRNENLDYKHLAEFYQMDGIIVGQGLSVRHLMGFLTEFYKKLGMAEVKLWPTYFPYTEPSLEVIGYSKTVKAWIELSGSGVFRPEVTIPLGVKVPVLAWGPGIERLMMMRYGLDDMRTLYGEDLSWLRERRELAGS